jgi:predicted phosphoribosyltransferase
MSDRLFHDRRDAGRVLAGLLDHYRGRPDVVVLALPRGGVPVGYEVARALGAPLDVFVVRKLGVPEREELAMGAIAPGGVVVLNEDVIRGLNISPEVSRRVAEREGQELLRRERAYRGGRPPVDVRGKTVILVDDGLATGSSMKAATRALHKRGPAQVVVAVPAAPSSSCEDLSADVDEVVCATTPSPFYAVGASYWDFTQTTDDEVRQLLRAASETPTVDEEGPTDASLIRAQAAPAEDGTPRIDMLLDLVGDAHFVLIGEASHGTHEFYAARAAMTRTLIEEKGFGGRVSAWNLRDRHMTDTLDRLVAHLTRQRGQPARIVVWAHNSHLGDARATEMGLRGELNVGQLVRERHPDDCSVIGFTTYTGTVTAADDWGGPAQRKWVRPALPDSAEELFHEAGQKEFMIAFGSAPPAADLLSSARLERAIGVIYRPETERASHYFRARVSDQFDAVIHIDETRAVEPLERTTRWQLGDVPETYPYAV